MARRAFGEWVTYMDAMNSGAVDYLSKPVRREDILAVARKALARRGIATPNPSPTPTEQPQQTDRQIPAGLSGPFIVDPKRPKTRVDLDYTVMLQEWRVNPKTGKTWPAMPAMSEPNFFTINGKAFPATESLDHALSHPPPRDQR